MSEAKTPATVNTRRIHVGLGALALGVLGDWSMLAWPDWGLNVALMMGAALVLLALIVREHRIPVGRSARLFLALAGFFSLCFLWRDAPGLKLLCLCIVLGAIGLAARAELGPGLFPAARLGSFVKELLRSASAAIAVPFDVLPGVSRWIGAARSGPRRNLMGVLRGLMIAGVLFAVFGSLFALADESFASAAGRFLSFDLGSMLSHLVGVLFWAWCGGAFFLQVLEPRRAPSPGATDPAVHSSLALELNFSLALLNGLFLSFVLLQISHFFGGHGHVEGESGLTYADYARRGFFELAWVAGLALVLLLGWDAMLQGASRSALRVFRLLGALLVLLVMVIIASAMHRMNLYTEVYGLTVLRLYVSAFMIWIVLVFVWFALSVLRGKAEAFPAGLFASGLMAAFLLLAINPHRLIAENNIARLAEGKSFDHAYLLTLSDDALPVLIEHAGDMPVVPRQFLGHGFDVRRNARTAFDWRSWNRGRSEARAALDAWVRGRTD